MINSWLDFFETFFGKTFDVAFMILSYPVFGVPLFAYLLTFLIINYVFSFIMHGQVSLGGASTIAGGISRASESAKQRRRERADANFNAEDYL